MRFVERERLNIWMIIPHTDNKEWRWNGGKIFGQFLAKLGWASQKYLSLSFDVSQFLSQSQRSSFDVSQVLSQSQRSSFDVSQVLSQSQRSSFDVSQVLSQSQRSNCWLKSKLKLKYFREFRPWDGVLETLKAKFWLKSKSKPVTSLRLVT